ncbi:MAG: RNA methyltransferase [Clostridia bacterium]|nr:RNA methyltransferase [Clostridia bacterium]
MSLRIESSSNSIYKHVKKLQSKSARSRFNQYIAEGKRCVSDAISNGADVEYLVVCEGVKIDFDTRNLRVYEFAPKIFDSLSLTVNSQGIVAVINYELETITGANLSGIKTAVYLDCITDPGNMGTIIRSCDALGADAIIITKGCVDIFNPKVVRSAMASMMNIPVFVDDNPDESFSIFKTNGFSVVGTFPTGDTYSCNASYGDKVLLVMGNEANGISDEISKYCTSRVKIPMFGRAESLNVATALTVMLYEISRGKICKNSNDRGEV